MKTTMINVLKNLGTIVLVGCAVLVTMAVVRREFFPPTPPSEEPRTIDDWEPLSRAGHRSGPLDAPIVVVEFADFQCPFCATAARHLRELRDRFGEEVAVIYRHFPLTSIHPFARDAAIASECAAAQDRFEAFHDSLFANQDDIGVKEWLEFADEAEVPSMTRFAKCLEEDWAAERVRDDSRAADRIALTSTPSVIVNGLLLPGTPSLETLEFHVERILDAQRAPGVPIER